MPAVRRSLPTAPFDVDAFSSRPHTARVARAYWILTEPWARLVVDECDPRTGVACQVIARGRAESLPFDVARGRRKRCRYLGDDEGSGIALS